jgi:hypothetical protein
MGLLDDAIREHLDLKRRHGADPAEVERLEREALGPGGRDARANEQAVSERPSDDARPFDDEHEFHDDRGPLDRGAVHEDENPFIDHPTEFIDHPEEPPAHDSAESHEEDEPRRRGFLGRRGHRSETDPDRPQESVPPRYQREEPVEDHRQFDDEPHGSAATPGGAGLGGSAALGGTAAAHPEAEDELFEKFEEPEAHLSGETVEYDVTTAFEEEEISFMDHVAPRPRTEPPPPAQREQAPPRKESRDEPPTGADVLEETPEFLQDTPDHDRLWFEQRPPKDFDFDK